MCKQEKQQKNRRPLTYPTVVVDGWLVDADVAQLERPAVDGCVAIDADESPVRSPIAAVVEEVETGRDNPQSLCVISVGTIVRHHAPFALTFETAFVCVIPSSVALVGFRACRDSTRRVLIFTERRARVAW